jgi:hypothetical protein
MRQEQNPPFPLFRRALSPYGSPPLDIPWKPHGQDTKSEFKNHPPFVRLPSFPGIPRGSYDDLGTAEPFPDSRSNGPYRSGPRCDGRPELLAWNPLRDPDLADGQRRKDRRHSPLMVLMWVGQREDVDPPDPPTPEERHNPALSRVPSKGTSSVDQHVPASGKRNDVGSAFPDVQRRE